ncbi:MAG TPA: hypothetical protein VGM29_08475 [Polyangiaceae bacterium]|jgi:hypothetical protein
MQRSLRRRASLLLLLLAGATGCLALVDFKAKCNSTSDCGADLRCDSASSTCEALIPCKSDASCGNYTCNTASGFCYADCDLGLALIDNPHCAGNALCNADSTCE